ncbi:MAG: phytanoyl-CoA dioxygenase family protein [Pseudomonadota bacterium]
MSTVYEQHGYRLHKALFAPSELAPVHAVLTRFHAAWLEDNADFYASRAINSANLTATRYLDDEARMTLFRFVGSQAVRDVVLDVLPQGAMFINTQLFFDPANASLDNYWHRDSQYNETSIDAQKRALKEHDPLHLRIAFKPERGISLVPGTHRRWDTDHEFDVRMGRNGCAVHDDLDDAVDVALEPGDGLLFSAAMIHRGLYGGDRLAFDLLFSNIDPTFASFVDPDCLPSAAQLVDLDWPAPFAATRDLIEGC